MKQQYILYLVLLNIMCAFLIKAEAQITIGSANLPDSNAILEFKEQEDNSSSRGLLLPRVRLQGIPMSAPLSRHVGGMIVYNKQYTREATKGIFVNSGERWIQLGAPEGGVSGQFLVIDSISLKPTWKTVNMPQAEKGKYSLVDSRSHQIVSSVLEFGTNNSQWKRLGNSIKINPAYPRNRVVITVQTLVLKPYTRGVAGWISYSGAIFVNNQQKDSRIGRLVFQAQNTKEAFQLETLHFILEDLPIEEQQEIHIGFKRRDSRNSGEILYIGPYKLDSNSSALNSSISYEYYEDKTS